MALTLPPALFAAQDAAVRKPCIEMLASRLDKSIPFTGNRLDEITDEESGLSVLLHSSGRVYVAYIVLASHIKQIQLVYTNTERTQFTYVKSIYISDLEECALVELFDGNIGLVVTGSNSSAYAIVYVFNSDGEIQQSKSLPASYCGINGLAINRRGNDYLLMFSKPAPTVKPVVLGNYTSNDNRTYTLSVRGDGTNAEAQFMYSAVSPELPMGDGAPVSIDSGLAITWPSAVYFHGQEFYFTAYRATYSRGSIKLDSIPEDGATITIAGQTYTFKDALTYLPEDPDVPDSPHTRPVPYEVKIDHLSREISFENLNCAINASAYEGSGAGFRYAFGTPANASVESSRSAGTVGLSLTSRQQGQVTYEVAYSDNSHISGDKQVTGGINSRVSEVTTLASSKTFTAITPDLRTFSAPKEIALQGVGAIRGKKLYNLTRLPDGRIMLAFDCITAGHSGTTTVTNIFYAISSDNGESWSSAKAISNYTTPQVTVGAARIAVKNDTTLTLSYVESTGCLIMNEKTHTSLKDTDGRIVTTNLAGGIFNVDFVRRRAYISSNNPYLTIAGAGPRVRAIVEIDIDSWDVLKAWTVNGYPALPRWAASTEIEGLEMAPHWSTSYSDGRYLCLCATTVPQVWMSRMGAILVLDVIANSIKALHLRKWVYSKDSNYVLTQNVDFEGSDIAPGDHCPLVIRAIAAQDKLWVLLQDENDGTKFELAYFDLTQVFDISVSRYSMHTVYKFTVSKLGETENVDLVFNAAENIWLINTSFSIKILDAGSYGVLREINKNTVSNLPINGLRWIAYRNGKIYGSAYHTENEAKYNGIQGLCIVDLSRMMADYYIPDAAQAGYYDIVFQCTHLIGETMVVGSNNDGYMLLFDEATKTWRTMNTENTRGFTKLASLSWFACDESTGTIYTAGSFISSTLHTPGFQLVNLEGDVRRAYYCDINMLGDKMEFSSPKLLIKGNAEGNSSVFHDPDDSAIYCFWQRTQNRKDKVFWEKEQHPLDLSRYLLRGSDITITKTIDATPGTLSFTVSGGHLFDTTNTASAISSYLAKGKLISIRIGELIGNAKVYTELADVFTIRQTSMSYNRGTYPVMTVECADRRCLFEQMTIVASEYYKTAPHQMMIAILQKYCGYKDGQNFRFSQVDEAGAIIEGQIIDQNALDVLNQIAERFGYFLYVDLGDVITMRKVNLNRNVDHTYAAHTWLVDYTPDDSFSDFTNKITVTGESAVKVPVLMPEELALTDSGTVGWWNRKKTKRMYYSTDEQRSYVNPRLVKVESVSNIAFKLAGKMKEYISSPAIANTYVEVTIEAPNIFPVIMSGIGMILMSKSLPPTPLGGQSKIAAVLETSGLYLVLQCLCAVANYQYEIYAQPVGYVRRSFQASASDAELLKQLNGTVIEKKIDNQFCYSQAQCETVAKFEMSIAKAQRKRVKLTKIMHLQDEVGDVIKINHPHSQLPQRLFITDITRRITIPVIGEESSVGLIDEVEGWKL